MSRPSRREPRSKTHKSKTCWDCWPTCSPTTVFFYGNADVADVLELFQDLSNANSYGPLYFMAAGEGDAMSPQEMQGKAALYALAKNLDKLKIPTTVMGFSVEDEERAKAHLVKLEMMLGMLAFVQPDLAERVTRQDVGDDSFLTFTLDAEMIPWDEVPLDDIRELEDQEGDVDKIVEKINELELVVALGLREGHLMVAVTDSVESLTELGTGESLLSRPELKVIQKYADERITGVSYVSEDFVTRMQMSAEDLDGLLMIGDAALKQLPLEDEAKDRIRKDAEALADDIKSLLPEAGAAVSVSFLTEKGAESYAFNWTENRLLDSSQSLDVLKHIGGDPLLAIAWREHIYPDVYDRVVHWVRIGHGYFKEFAVPEMSKKDRRQYNKVVKLVQPLCERLGEVNRESLIPAFSGQSAIVIDAKLMSKQIAAGIPATEEAMPLLEPAIIVGIKDADAMRQAYVGYQDFFNDLLAVARELDENGEIPEGYEIPWPDVSETSDSSTLTYELPSELGVDDQIVPNAVLTDDFAVVTASEGHSERLLKSTASRRRRRLGRCGSPPCRGRCVQLGSHGRRPDAMGPVGGKGSGQREPRRCRPDRRHCRSGRNRPRSAQGHAHLHGRVLLRRRCARHAQHDGSPGHRLSGVQDMTVKWILVAAVARPRLLPVHALASVAT